MKEYVSEYFDINQQDDAPFMLLIVEANTKARQKVPAVVHSDGTARVQTVTVLSNPDFYKTLFEFNKLSGVPILINTSFNVNGEAIVETPIDAIESFFFMDIDYLAIDSFWINKNENANIFSTISHSDYLELRRERYRNRFADIFPSIDPRKYCSWFYSEQR